MKNHIITNFNTLKTNMWNFYFRTYTIYMVNSL